jgi:hypothetical protein
VAGTPPSVAGKRELAAQQNRGLRQGYLPLNEVHLLLERIADRMNQIDEPLAREYVLDPFPGGIEQKIQQMCRRRKALFDRLIKAELDAEQDRVVTKREDTAH